MPGPIARPAPGRRGAPHHPRSVTLTLLLAQRHLSRLARIPGRWTRQPSASRSTVAGYPDLFAGQRPGSATIELTVGRHDGGRVSTFLNDFAHPGMVLGISAPGATFSLNRDARRILFVSGGSGITPMMSMVRTLCAEGVPR